MIERKILFDGLLVITTCSDKLTGEELIESAHWMIDNFDGLIKPGFSQLFDALRADTAAVSEDDLHRISQINMSIGKIRGSFSMAILSVKPYPRALAQLYKLLSVASDIRVEIFSDREAAYQWLGYPEVEADTGHKKKLAVGSLQSSVKNKST